MIRVGQLSTSITGGAGISARRLNQGLLSHGIDSTFIHAPDSSFAEVKQITSKVVTGLQRLMSRDVYGLATPISISRLNRDDLLHNYDILHIHNWYNLISLKDIEFLGQRKPIIFTLHDERIISGGCHITNGCHAFQTKCSDCPAVRFGKNMISDSKTRTSRTLDAINTLQIIGPSKWIMDQWSSAYPELNANLNLIPNIIQYPEDMSRKKDSEEFFEILFVSANLNAEVKGLATLLLALDSIPNQINNKLFRLNLVGRGVVDTKPHKFQIRKFGQTESSDVAGIMASCDLLVVPSVSENSPNVIAEALLAKLPVLATNVGGIPELIQNGRTGFLTEANVASISGVLIDIFRDEKFSAVAEEGERFARNRWMNHENIQKHISVYESLVR